MRTYAGRAKGRVVDSWTASVVLSDGREATMRDLLRSLRVNEELVDQLRKLAQEETKLLIPAQTVQTHDGLEFTVGLPSEIRRLRARDVTMRAHAAVIEALVLSGAVADHSEANELGLPRSSATLVNIITGKAKDGSDKSVSVGKFQPIVQRKRAAYYSTQNSPSKSARSTAESQAWHAIQEGTSWLTAKEVGARVNPNAVNPQAIASRWRREGRIFGVSRFSSTVFPGYAFNPTGEPVKGMREVLTILGDLPPHRLAAWFESTNNYLEGKRPRELLEMECERVIDAARLHVQGFVHG